jgi:hypothetical protein
MIRRKNSASQEQAEVVAGSGGPKGKRNGMWKHGRYSQEMVEMRREVRRLMREAKETIKGALGGFVRRFQFCQVHREVENDLDWFGTRMGIVVAINVDLHLPTVSHDPASAMLK